MAENLETGLKYKPSNSKTRKADRLDESNCYDEFGSLKQALYVMLAGAVGSAAGFFGGCGLIKCIEGLVN